MVPRGRKARNVQFLNKLKEISGCDTVDAFARACGKLQPNMSNWLNGVKVPETETLKSCTTHLFGWNVKKVKEVEPLPDDRAQIPEAGGIYILYDSSADVLYIGKATNLRTEIDQALRKELPSPIRTGPQLRRTKPILKDLTSYVSIYEVPSDKIRHNLEALLLCIFPNQTHNTNIGHFK